MNLKTPGLFQNISGVRMGIMDWLIYYWPGERAKEEMKRGKIKSINNRAKEYLPGPKEGEKYFLKSRLI